MGEVVSTTPTPEQARFDEMLGKLEERYDPETGDLFMGTRTSNDGMSIFNPDSKSPYSPRIFNEKFYLRRSDLVPGVDEQRFHKAMISLIGLEKIVGKSRPSQDEQDSLEA